MDLWRNRWLRSVKAIIVDAFITMSLRITEIEGYATVIIQATYSGVVR
jgi:hypothetical protein